nr:zinc finger, CCHC-type [Tanacetum cinerariifolium]
MTGAKFDIEKFDETDDFGLWRIKRRALLIQHGCEADLKVLPADIEAQTKAELNKKAHSAVILCLVWPSRPPKSKLPVHRARYPQSVRMMLVKK